MPKLTYKRVRCHSFKGAGGLVAFDEATGSVLRASCAMSSTDIGFATRCPVLINRVCIGDRYQDGASFEVRSWIPISDDNGSPTVDPTVIAVQVTRLSA